MFSRNYITPEYIDNCSAKIDAQIECYNNLVAKAKSEYNSDENLDEAMNAFEPVFFNNMLLMVDCYFSNADSDMEQKSNNVFTEVRAMCHSIMHNNNMMTLSNYLSLDTSKSVLNYEEGDEIMLNETDFIKLSNAFLNVVERRYSKMQDAV